jgi:hypothetical protein
MDNINKTAKALNLTEKEFPDAFESLNDYAKLIENTLKVKMSTRQLAASVINEACRDRIQNIQDHNSRESHMVQVVSGAER